ncbi:MAG: hypothetical protein AAF419_04495 [Pseudomonadota bacterium]
MDNSLTHYNLMHATLLLLLIFFCSIVSAETIREFQERKCAEGNQKSCERAADLLEGEQHAERIVKLGDDYAVVVDRSILEEENKPKLKNAYSEVLADYFSKEAENGVKQLVAGYTLNICAEHYHNHWRNRKMWWPTKDSGEPDWSTIYYYIVEHYYGYCLRATNNAIH